ncbi:MAG TPA: efflux RND transporter periplasmic adaptor subunit [Bryobacteraceae bacterium]|nr:efflux RND transporter periplasmic adaptor subunit [Bryobacteraceae bacterium]
MPTITPYGAQAAAPEPEPPQLRPRTVPPPSPSSRTAWWWGAAAILVAAGAAGWWQREAFAPASRKAPGAPAVRTVAASSGSLEKSVRVTGVTGAERFAVLMAPQMRGSRQGRSGHEFNLVLQRVVRAGALVKKGDEVAEFDRQYILQRMQDFKASVDQHSRNVTRLKANLMVSRAAYQQLVIRAKGQMEKAALDLKKIPILSANQAEKYRLDYEEASESYKETAGRSNNVEISEGAAVRRAELDYKQTQLEYSRAERHVNTLLVHAPINGMVVMETIRRGGEQSQIQAGDQVGAGQTYMRIVDLSDMIVNANMNQVDAQHVRLGMEARIHFDAYPELELPAQVVAVGAFAVQTGWRGSYVRSVPVRLKLDHTDPRVIPDLSVSADLLVERAEDVTIVPREAVFGSEGEHYAFVQAAGGKWDKRPVEVTLENSTAVAVASGVNPGDVLAAEVPPAHAVATDSH